MNKRAFLSLLVLLCVLLRVPAQTDQDDVVRITTNLVLSLCAWRVATQPGSRAGILLPSDRDYR